MARVLQNLACACVASQPSRVAKSFQSRDGFQAAARTTRTDITLGFHANMPNFARPAVCTAQRLMVDDQPATDADFSRDVDERVRPLGNPGARVGDSVGCQVGLVRNEGDAKVVKGVKEFLAGNISPAKVGGDGQGVSREEAGEGK